MRLAWAVALLTTTLMAGCETMESADSPFRPVKVQASSSEPGVSEPIDSEPFWNDGETLILSSEDMAIGALAAGSAPPPVAGPALDPNASGEAVATTDESAAGVVDPAVDAATSEAATLPSASPISPALTGWPVRLVRTLPETQPPRAILGLPDGTEIVVSPGSMIPAHGLVVVAIGRQSAQLARVTALGDHASVDQVTLTALY